MAGNDSGQVLREGTTCWRIATARRLALIVDAARYFSHLKAAMLKAEQSIYLIGWDFDTRIRLEPGTAEDEWPDTLGPFLNALVDRRPNLRIFLLKWDLGVLQTLGRGATPLFLFKWASGERVRFELDGEHPPGGCHHQKIAVIDDTLAFCGGIDITVGRWDTREHLDTDPNRRSPWGFQQPPWHDATTAIEGDAARALGDLARTRWKHATGEDLEPPSASNSAWPEGLQPLLRQVPVGIARTLPAYKEAAEVREIEALYLAAIRSARKAIYIESQYLSSKAIGDALATKLAAAQGPDIVVVNPQSAEGWLEEEVMGTARSLIVERLRRADHQDRFRLYYPVTKDGQPIYVHAKIMIVDDRILKVGSSNLNNRSMGLDTECDIAVEAGPSENDPVRCAIHTILLDLLAEHLGTSGEAVAQAFSEGNRLIAAIESLNRGSGRRLLSLDPPPLTELERRLAENRTLDPERPTTFLESMRRLAR